MLLSKRSVLYESLKRSSVSQKLRKPFRFSCLDLALVAVLSNVAFRDSFDLLENRLCTEASRREPVDRQLRGRNKNSFSVCLSERFFTCQFFSFSLRNTINKYVNRFIQLVYSLRKLKS